MAKINLTAGHAAQSPQVEHIIDDNSPMAGDDARIAAFRQDHDQGKLPNLPNTPGFKSCWVSLMHQEDTPHRRQRYGWRFMRPQDMPHYDASMFPAGGNTAAPADRIQVQEMVAMEIPLNLYAEYMRINHVERPNAEADKIKAHVEQAQQMVHEARLGNVIESDALQQMRQRHKAPDFAAEEAHRTA